MNKTFTALLSCLLTLAFSSQAVADCSEMEGDEWDVLIQEMATAYEQDQLEEALTAAKRLTLICNRSPVVNFTMSEIYRKMGNEQESYNSVKRATEYMLDYPVPQALTEKIWMRRAEFDLPYKKQLEDLQNQLNTNTGEFGSRLKQADEELAKLTNERDELQERNQQLLESQMKMLQMTKWIGAGTAIGGTVIAAVGAGIMGAYYSKAHDKYGENWNDFDKKDAMVHGGIAMLTTGIGLGVAGSAVAIFAYIKSLRLESANAESFNNGNSSENLANGIDYDFRVSPGSIVFNLTF
ncbi:MAG: hypothetical protein J6A01_00160 [Proteobacteria bacterium]|nr:hypothetical protein [Pseudomonadota bacterium]